MTEEQSTEARIGKAQNPEIDEQTAVALTILIDNHIAALEKWKRKFKDPFINKPHVVYHPTYPKPTVGTVLHLSVDGARFKLESLKVINAFLERRKEKV